MQQASTHAKSLLRRQVIDPPGSQYMMLVMEFLEKGPVLQTHDQAGFDCLPEEVAADYFRQAVAGLEYLHFHKVRAVRVYLARGSLHGERGNVEQVEGVTAAECWPALHAVTGSHDIHVHVSSNTRADTLARSGCGQEPAQLQHTV